ncbi:MAG: SRPBCC family protein [Planctomycetales bacterium]|nr:SRPBCC family protein [Planctomycetales bacterium]
MPRIELLTEILAPIETCFDLARSVDLHIDSTNHTNERAVDGVTSGLVRLGDTVTWEATHFLVRQQLAIEVVQYDRPRHFRDSMIWGAFKHFDHDHFFEATDTGTRMKDVFEYTSPLGVFGRLANILFVDRHMRKLLLLRNGLIKSVAESSDAGRYLSARANAG